MSDVDQINALAQLIRCVDGNHTMGVGALAEAILEHRAEWDTPRIIRTVEELEAEDPDTVLGVWNDALDMGCIFLTAGELAKEPADPRIKWAVIRDGAEVRAARKALDKETNND